jgi:hypothetical protein
MPDRDMIRAVTEDDQTVDVIPNRRLGKYLQREVSALLASVNIQVDQTPDTEVLSDDDVTAGADDKAPPRQRALAPMSVLL